MLFRSGTVSAALLLLLSSLLVVSVVNADTGHNDTAQPFVTSVLTASSSALPQALSDLTATRVGNEEAVYLAGGCNSATGNTFNEDIGEFICDSISDQFYKFNVATETFDTVAALPVQRYRHAAAAAGGDYVVLLGGRTVEDNIVTTVDVS